MENERKTLDQRHAMSDLERLRHSCAHVMATAILRLWPDAQFAAGPPVEQGFYYDVDLQHRITPDDFAAIEAEMKKEIKANRPFEKKVVTREQAIADAFALVAYFKMPLLFKRNAASAELDDQAIFVALFVQAVPEFVEHRERAADDGPGLVLARIRFGLPGLQVGSVICVHRRLSAVQFSKEKRPGRSV